jgi:hypothetical protein
MITPIPKVIDMCGKSILAGSHPTLDLKTILAL